MLTNSDFAPANHLASQFSFLTGKKTLEQADWNALRLVVTDLRDELTRLESKMKPS